MCMCGDAVKNTLPLNFNESNSAFDGNGKRLSQRNRSFLSSILHVNCLSNRNDTQIAIKYAQTHQKRRKHKIEILFIMYSNILAALWLARYIPYMPHWMCCTCIGYIVYNTTLVSLHNSRQRSHYSRHAWVRSTYHFAYIKPM